MRCFVVILAFLALVPFIASCDSVKTKDGANYPKSRPGGVVYTDEEESIFGDDGLSIFSTKEDKTQQGGNALGVNKYLWSAALDTLSFMPLASADPFGGVIITDWYSPTDTPNERFKANVFLSGTALKATGVKVTAFKQLQTSDGWKDSPTAQETATKLEDAILAKARELRIAEE